MLPAAFLMGALGHPRRLKLWQEPSSRLEGPPEPAAWPQGSEAYKRGRSRRPPFPAGGKAVARPWAREGACRKPALPPATRTGPQGGRSRWQRKGRRAPCGRTGRMT